MQQTTDKIFISYSRQDAAFARKLAIWLNNTLSVGVWIDVDDIPPGIKWSAAIQDGLDNCEVMVVVITPDSMNSINVEDEWQYFLDQNKPVVPILLKSAPIPYQLRRIQYIDFSLKEEYANSQRQLIVELRRHLSPMPQEKSAANKANRPATQGARPTPTKKAMRTQQTIKQSESLLKEQQKALKRSNTLTLVLVGILLVVAIGLGAIIYTVLTRDVRVFVVDTGNGTAIAFVPGSSQGLSISGSTELPLGSRVVAADEPISFQVEGSGAEGVLLPNSAAVVSETETQGLNINLQDGAVSLDTSGGNGRVETDSGIQINAQDSVDVQIDAASATVRTTCYDGNCTISDPASGRMRELEQDSALVFNSTAGDFDTAPLLPIPGEVAYVTYRHSAPEIYLMDADGQNPKRLTNNNAEDQHPSWSPDGTQIAFETYVRNNADIALISPDGGEPVYLTGPEGQDRSPAWSPNGRLIAFISDRDDSSDIYLMNADGSDIRRLTSGAGAQSTITWSPDGTQIAFVNGRTGNGDIFIVRIDGSEEPRNISIHTAPDSTPAWSPDGTRIAFTSRRDNPSNEDIYVLVLETNEITNITNHPASDTDPVWSRDGSQIIFTSQRDGFKDIYAIVADGSGEVTNLTNLPRIDDQSAAWLHPIRAGQ